MMEAGEVFPWPHQIEVTKWGPCFGHVENMMGVPQDA